MHQPSFTLSALQTCYFQRKKKIHNVFPLLFGCLHSLESFLPSVYTDLMSWYIFPTLPSGCSFLDHAFVLSSKVELGSCGPAW